jgi:hypothetical protein
MKYSDYINYVPNGDLIYHSISMLPLLIWGYVIYYYVNFSPSLSSALDYQKGRLIELQLITKSNKFSNTIINYLFLFIRTFYLLFWMIFPFFMYLFNLFRAENISLFIKDPDTNKDGIISIKEFLTWIFNPINIKYRDNLRKNIPNFNTAALPPGMNACMNTSNITPEQKENGILAWFDWKCRATQTNIIQTFITRLVNSFYYINYCLFLIVLLTFTHQTKTEMTDWRKNATLINWIFISLFFGTLGTTLTVFDSYSWWSMIFVDLATVILSMNVASFGILVAAIVNAIYFTPHNFSMKLF